MRNRKPNRLRNYDYSAAGAYFVTICVHCRERVFGDILEGTVELNEWGKIVENCWNDLPNHYANCRPDMFVVMPNHVHGIMWIVGGDSVDSIGNGLVRDGLVGNGFKPFPTQHHGLPEIIRGFKSFSSRRINEKLFDRRFRWQKSYHDRIIRDDDELHRIRRYIAENPANWHQDSENV